MQAVILVGGEGTRLRPLTSSVPKTVVPLVDRPLIVYMLEWLRGHGVDDVIMSCGFLATGVREVLGDGSQLGHPPALRRGARAARHRRRAEVRRGAARRALPHAQRRRPHRPRPHAPRSPSTRRPARSARSRSCPVADPSSYGLVRLRERPLRRGVPREAVARRAELDTNLISAGAYVLERSVLDLIPPDQKVSIEREVWPRARRPRPLRLRRRRTPTGSTSARPRATCR